MKTGHFKHPSLRLRRTNSMGRHSDGEKLASESDDVQFGCGARPSKIAVQGCATRQLTGNMGEEEMFAL